MSEAFWTLFFATLPATLAALAALIVAIVNALKTNRIAEQVEVVHKATNSLTEKLVASTDKEAFARGMKAEKDKEA